jgi:hypothetical protein
MKKVFIENVLVENFFVEIFLLLENHFLGNSSGGIFFFKFLLVKKIFIRNLFLVDNFIG